MCGYTISLRKALADFFCWRKLLFSGKGKGKARAPPEFRQQREILLTHPGFVKTIFRHILDAGIRNVESYSSYFQTRRFFFHLESIIHGRSSQTNAKTMSNLPEVCHIIFSLRVPQSWQERNEKRLPLLGHWCLLWRGLPFSVIWPHAIMWCKLWLLVGQAYNGSAHRSGCTSLYSLLYCTFQVLPFVLVSAFRLKRNISQPPDQLCTNFYMDTHKLSQTMICKQMIILIGCFDGRYVICLHRASPHCRAKGFTPKVADETPKKPAVAPLGQVWDAGWHAAVMFHLSLGFI